MSHPYTILVGNSPNLLVNPRPLEVSWEAITRKLEEAYREILDDKNLPSAGDALLSLRMENLQNILQREKRKQEKAFSVEQKDCVSRLENAWSNWYGDLLRLEPGPVHRLVVKWMLERDAALITTNYDLTFEKALSMDGLPAYPDAAQHELTPSLIRQEIEQNAFRCQGRVWHMHGDASCPASIVASKSSYHKALSRLGAAVQQKGSWLYQFLHSKVFICGLNFRQDEDVLLYALQHRAGLPEEEQNPVFYFHFCREGEAGSADGSVIQLLDQLRVELIEIPVHSHPGGFDYQSAWYHLMGRIWENTAKDLIVTSPPSKAETSDVQSQQCISPVPGRHRSSRRGHTVTTSTPTMQNPDRCWLNIGVEKLKKNQDKDWIFECRIDNRLYIYRYPARELDQIFVQKGVPVITNTPRHNKNASRHSTKSSRRYSLFIDYRQGELYSTVSAFNTTPLVTLKRAASSSERSLMD